MNEDYTLTTFTEPITALADDPQLPPDEMKRRLQAPADELRQAHNALAGVVHGITEATYPDTVTEDMLTDALSEKINGKADISDVSDEVNALDARLDTVETALPEKCEATCGVYYGNGEQSREIILGFRPKAVLILQAGYQMVTSGGVCFGGLALDGRTMQYKNNTAIAVTDQGFQVAYLTGDSNILTNYSGNLYFYVALT